jgi:5-methylcytosine-specific restriction protein A
MPEAPTRSCSRSGCRALVQGGGPCAEHRRSTWREREASRPARDTFYDTVAWREYRAWFLARHPLCEMDCKARGLVTAAKDVDHKVRLVEGGKAFDEANCQAGCHSCHSRKTAYETFARPRGGARGRGGRISSGQPLPTAGGASHTRGRNGEISPEPAA